MSTFKESKQRYERTITQAEQQLAAVRASIENARKDAEVWEGRCETAAEALAIAQTAAERLQNESGQAISAIVSRCLSAVFSAPYTFKIIFEKKRNKTEARFVFCRDGLEIDPLTSAGGGVVDVAAFALRVAALMLARPPVRRLLVLDEPFRFVSVEYRPAVADLMQQLADEMKLQMIMVSHIPEYVQGNVISVSGFLPAEYENNTPSRGRKDAGEK